ncbi:AAA family ATPase [Brevibacillus sp. LEMMJ03]|uniref:AAA family ATPase n=1 Tax=Brevibacillus sp. LEMMJ03 TaxID=2595056 RepID=UPI00117F32D8|nr:AAA family ATPase [Brevibacillus sp. LEMMJ03]TRY26090.1 AAA family ATPase [Brevibacillus sp. LEMMJ03]
MKPIRLKLAGLHSYREMQEVDFETLCEAGLFGIFGPTGSGKSTILDAITLALFGQVVRQGGGSHPKDVLNQLEQRVFVSFTFELGKAGERRRYTIEREFGLDKKGNRRPPEVRLIQCGQAPGEPDVVLESKANAATAAVEALIGLTLQDFTRAVVLPQGQFSRFLTLKGSERNEMLQRMFHLHIYGEKLNERVRAALEKTRARLHELQLEAAALGDAGPEALQAAREALEEAARQEQVYAEQKQELVGKIKEMEQLYQWQQELERVRERLDKQMARQAEADEWKARIAEWEASVRLWPLVQQWERLEAEWTEAARKLEQSRREQEAARQAHEAAESEYQRCQSALMREEPLLIEQKSRLIQAAEWETELAALRDEWTVLEREQQAVSEQLAETERQLAADEAALENGEREWQRLAEQLAAAAVTPEWRDLLTAAREAKQHWEREVNARRELEAELASVEREQQAASAEAEKLRASWEASAARLAEARKRLEEQLAQPLMSDAEWEHARDTLAQIKQVGRQWRDLLQQMAVWQEKWQAAVREGEQAEARCGDLEAAWQAEDARLARLQAERDRLRAEWERWQEANMARLLRERLSDGEPCPVCGSTHHPQAVPGGAGKADGERDGRELRERVKAAEEALREAERQLRTAFEALQAAKAERSAREQRQAALREEREALEQRIAAVRQECASHGDKWKAGSIQELLDAYQREDAALREQAARRERLAAERERLQQQADALREQEAEERRRYERIAVLMEQLHRKQAEMRERLEAAALRVAQAEAALDAKRGDLPMEEIERRFEEIGRKDREAARLQQVRSEQEAQMQRLRSRREAAKAARAELLAREASLRERHDDRKRLWEQKQAQWLERTGGTPACERLALVERSLSALREALTSAEERRRQTAEARERVQNDLVKHSETYAVLTRQRAEAAEALQRALMESGLGTPERVRELYGEKELLPQYQERLAAFESEWARLRYDEERLVQALDGRTVGSEEWLAAKRAWDEWEQAYHAAKEQVAVARQVYASVEENHGKWQELQKLLEAETDELSRLEELKKLLEGKAFVQFIAEEKLASIARDASHHLKRMTKNRYALEIGDEGEFVLRDEGAGGMRRPVSTLSGGETFLTSLALALALSMEIQMRGGRLEFFFLDEGFGTLDPELLEVVIDALERLRMDDFTIGVISHVPEIRVRMPRRLIVTPAEPLGEGSKISMEVE